MISMNLIPELATLFKPTFFLTSFIIGVFVIAYLSNLLIKKYPKGKILIYFGAVLAVVLLLYPCFYLSYPSDTFSYILKAIISLPLIFFIPGYVMFNALVKNHDLSFLEVVFIPILGSILISGWVGLTLAELGYFSLLNLILILIILCSFLGWKFKVRINLKPYPKPNINHVSIFLVIIIIIGVILFFHPMFTNFGADDGVLIPQGVNIAKTGAIAAHDPIIENMPKTAINEFYNPRSQFPCYAFFRDDQNIIRPQYFDFFPVFLAISYSLFGLENFLYINSFIALLSVLCIFILSKRLFNNHVAILSALLLTICFVQTFFAHYPGAEILDQFLVFSGIYAIMLLIKTNNPCYGILSAFAFSGCLVTRIDSLILYFPIVILLFMLLLTEKLRREHFFFFIPFLLLNIHVWSHVYFFDLPYFVDCFSVIGYKISYFAYSLFLVAILSLVIFISVLLRKYRCKIRLMINPLRNRIETLKLANSIFLVSVFVFLYFVRPQLDPNIVTGKTLLLLEQPLTIVGLLLATYGLIVLINEYVISENFQKENIIMSFFFLVGICYTVFYLINLRNNPVFPWAFRRYITVVIPFLIILMAYGVTRLLKTNGEKKLIKKSACFLIIAFLVFSFFTASIPIINKSVDTESLIIQTEKLANNFNSDDIVLLFLEKDIRNVNFGVILKYIFDKNAIVLPKNDINMEVFSKQINRWHEEGRNIYVVNPSLLSFKFLNVFELNHKSHVTINSSRDSIYHILNVYELSTTKYTNVTMYKHKNLLAPEKPPKIVIKYGTLRNNLKIVQFQHPPSRIQHSVFIPQNSLLPFSLALDPRVWSPDKGDGVLFEIFIRDNNSEKLIFSKYIDPKNNPEERKWNDFEIDLLPYANKNVTIVFVTSPGPNNDTSYDWAWWGNPRILSK